MILVIGEALIDLIENRYQPGAFNAIVGGANANVALALARRGAAHTFYARMSRDRFGDIIRKRLDDNDVLYGNSVITDQNSTLAIVSLNEAGSPTYSFYVKGTADWGWTPDELPTNAALAEMGVNCIQFGCLTMAMEPGNLVIEAWAKQTQGITISHDINIRAALGFDPEHERVRVERVNAFSHIIKASDEDIEWLYQGKRKVDDVAKDWAQNALVLITRGADGTSVFRGDERIDVPSRKINVVDTVGAGDTFCANLLGQLQDEGYLGSDLNQIPSDALRNFVYVAGIAASITCERAGCEPPTKDDLATVIYFLYSNSLRWSHHKIGDIMAGNETRVIAYLLKNKNRLVLPHLGVIHSVKNPKNGRLVEMVSAEEASKEDSGKKADVFLNDSGVSIKQSGSSFLFNRLQRANLKALFESLDLMDETGSFERLDDLVKNKHSGQIVDRDRHWSEAFEEEDFKALLRFLMMEGSPNQGNSLFPAKFILSAPRNLSSDSDLILMNFDEFWEDKKDQIYLTIRPQWIGQDSKTEDGRARAIASKPGNAPWVFRDITGTPSSGWKPHVPVSDRREVYMVYIQLIEGKFSI